MANMKILWLQSKKLQTKIEKVLKEQTLKNKLIGTRQ